MDLGPALLLQHANTSKYDPLCEEVNPSYAKVKGGVQPKIFKILVFELGVLEGPRGDPQTFGTNFDPIPPLGATGWGRGPLPYMGICTE